MPHVGVRERSSKLASWFLERKSLFNWDFLQLLLAYVCSIDYVFAEHLRSIQWTS